MHLELITPEKKINSDEAISVNMPAIDGMVEVLDRHAPMIAALKKGRVRISQKNATDKLIDITGGFAEVLNNQVVILAESATEL